MISTVVGNFIDDHTCQDNVDYSDRILGDENLVGFPESEGILSVHSCFINSCRRVWLSVFEFGVMNRLGLSGGLGEKEIIIMTGVCMRLLSCDVGLDTGEKLVGELLSICGKRLAMGFESLQIFLLSRKRRCSSDTS